MSRPRSSSSWDTGSGSRNAERSHENERLFETQNDLRMDELAGTVSRLKQVTLDIHGEVIDQNRGVVSDANAAFSSFGTGLKNTISRLGIMRATRHSRNMCLMVLGFLCLWILLWALLKRAMRSTPPDNQIPGT